MKLLSNSAVAALFLITGVAVLPAVLEVWGWLTLTGRIHRLDYGLPLILFVIGIVAGALCLPDLLEETGLYSSYLPHAIAAIFGFIAIIFWNLFAPRQDMFDPFGWFLPTVS